MSTSETIHIELREAIANEFELFEDIDLHCKFLIRGGNSPLIVSFSYNGTPDLIVYTSTLLSLPSSKHNHGKHINVRKINSIIPFLIQPQKIIIKGKKVGIKETFTEKYLYMTISTVMDCTVKINPNFKKEPISR
jgi:hypothetical protein